MEKMMQSVRGVGKVLLALLGGILFPILIWVALGVAVYQKVRERAVQRKPAPTIGEILAAAGLSIQEEAGTGKTAAKVFAQQSVPEISKLLARAGLTIHEEAAPKAPKVGLPEFKRIRKHA
jgi:hypothetical protein